jgi:excinuclease ABC subunit B
LSGPEAGRFPNCPSLRKKRERLGHPSDLTGGDIEGIPEFKSQEDLDVYIGKLESDMREAAKRFEFEKAAKLRDPIKELRTKEFLFA